MAPLGGTIVDGSLAVGDGVLSWRTTDGVAHSTPLTGETAVDCAGEPTLLSRGGIRVFEHLPPSGGDVQLYGCVGAAPILLLTGPRNSSWKVIGLGRKNGSAAVYTSGVAGNRLIAFGATPLQVVTPGASAGSGDRARRRVRARWPGRARAPQRPPVDDQRDGRRARTHARAPEGRRAPDVADVRRQARDVAEHGAARSGPRRFPEPSREISCFSQPGSGNQSVNARMPANRHPLRRLWSLTHSASLADMRASLLCLSRGG